MGKFAIGVLVGIVATVTTVVVGTTYSARRVRKAVVDCLDDLNEKQENEQENEQQFVHWEVDVLKHPLLFFVFILLIDIYYLFEFMCNNTYATPIKYSCSNGSLDNYKL